MMNRLSPASYGRYLLFIAGMGGLLYGVDVGIIAAALLYLDKTINLSIAQTSMIVAAVLGGSMASSLVAGVLADWIGRKTMMVISGLLFVLSILMIFVSHNFAVLFTGRLLQGVSGGFIAVVVPLYLAECLSAKTRGQGFSDIPTLPDNRDCSCSSNWMVLYASSRMRRSKRRTAMRRSFWLRKTTHGAACSFRWCIRELFSSWGRSFWSESPRWLFRQRTCGCRAAGAAAVVQRRRGAVADTRDGEDRGCSHA